jgi:O-succinylbenzoic acid--CoA ligase
VGGQAILFRSALYGTVVVLQQGFDPERINVSLDNDQITLVSLVPTMLHRLLETRTHWPDALRLILLGGAAADPSLIHRANSLSAFQPVSLSALQPVSQSAPQHSALIAPTYGLSEAASQVATILPSEAQTKPGTVGKPLLFTTIRIVDEQGQTLPTGTIGEVVIKGPTVMSGYWQNPQATAQTIRDGELFTGDLGYLDGDGDLWLVQRRSDLIVTGGENVYPAEVENILRQHPGVAAACVVGIPHPQWGQQVTALIVPQPGQALTPEQLIVFARHHLAGYKIPRHIQFTDKLPQTASGKIERHTVQKQLQTVSPGV